MNKEEAQKRIDNIQGGGGLNRSHFPGEMKGEIAQDQWNDIKFMYGMEYGYLLAMFDVITNEDSTEALPGEDSAYSR